MSKLDQLRIGAGGNIAESMGRGVDVADAPAMASGPGQDKLAGLKRLAGASSVPLDKIVRDPSQPREVFPEAELSELADSIRARGVLQPIRIRWDADLGSYVVIAGERRFRAARMAALQSVPCVIQDGPMSEADILLDQLAENLVRLDLQPIEQARAFKRLMTANSWSERRLASALHIDHEKVNRAVRLLDLAPDVQEAVAAGSLSPTTGFVVSRLDDPEDQRKVAERIISGDLSRVEATEIVETVRARSTKARAARKGKGGKPKPPPTSRTERTTIGCKVTFEHRRGVDAGMMLAALDEVAAKLRAEQGGEAEAA